MILTNLEAIKGKASGVECLLECSISENDGSAITTSNQE